jgi:hypothetical protein
MQSICEEKRLKVNGIQNDAINTLHRFVPGWYTSLTLHLLLAIKMEQLFNNLNEL